MDTLRESFRYGTSPLTSSSLASPYNTYLFGSHISKSLSPLLHGILFRSLGASWKFHLEQTTDKEKFQATLVAPETIGISITMPNKVTFGLLLDDLTEAAQVIGAVNTTFTRLDSTGKRRYIGTNTDCVGIRESIVQFDATAVTTAKGKSAMVIGGGGAARSAVYALWKWFSPSEIYIVNRLKSEVDDIVEHFTKAMSGIQLQYISDIATAQSLPAPSIIVSTIPDYPPSEPGEVLCWKICETIFQKADKGLLVDMCYMPFPETGLVKAARKAGWKTILGTEVLVRVCVAQEVLWTEKLPNQQGVSEAIAAISQSKDAAKL
jgi:quinate dehydrogenase